MSSECFCLKYLSDIWKNIMCIFRWFIQNCLYFVPYILSEQTGKGENQYLPLFQWKFNSFQNNKNYFPTNINTSFSFLKNVLVYQSNSYTIQNLMSSFEYVKFLFGIIPHIKKFNWQKVFGWKRSQCKKGFLIIPIKLLQIL